MTNESLPITSIKKQFWDFTERGIISEIIIETLLYKGKFISKESELWDFKEQPSGKNKTELAKTLLQVVSFHNTYGGYLIYGVKETEDGFCPVGISKQLFNNEQIKDKLTEVTGMCIDTSYNELNITIEDNNYLFGILHIPKREEKHPVFFGKNSPQKSDNKFYFKKDQIYMRMLDTCITPEKPEHFKLLYSKRIPSYAHDKSNNTICLSNTLPHRNSICPKFIGRDKIINELWAWLGDRLAHYKLIAGAGGLGKTSIAYEFAEQICSDNPLEFDKVVWLTGKRKQFIPLENDYVPINETHFSDLESLLKALGNELALSDEEIHDCSLRFLKGMVQDQLETLSMFVVIDDIDSLELEEQKKVINTIQLLANKGSRFLVTTRMNLSYSVDDCITVSGLEKDDFSKLVDNLSDKFKVSITNKEKDMLLKVTDGSPLFAESVIRLIRTGFNANSAIREWKGKSGEEARAAALHREVKTLSLESKRVLLVITLLKEASASEIRDVTGYPVSNFEKYISELLGLFLISSPPIIRTEKRFEVTSNTARLVLEIQNELVTDHRAVEKKAKAIRQASSSVGINKKKVGIAINQAFALLKEGRSEEAVETIENTMTRIKDNKDLLFAKGRFLLKLPSPKIKEARGCLKQSHVLGQRKDEFFICWLEAEKIAMDNNSQLEVTNLALESGVRNQTYWLVQRAEIYHRLASHLEGSSNEDREKSYLENAAIDLSRALKKAGIEDKDTIIELAQKTNDKIYSLAISQKTGEAWIDALKASLSSIKQGDFRAILYHRAAEAIENILLYKEESNIKAYINNKLGHRIKDIFSIFNDRKDIHTYYENVYNHLSEVEKKYLETLNSDI